MRELRKEVRRGRRKSEIKTKQKERTKGGGNEEGREQKRKRGGERRRNNKKRNSIRPPNFLFLESLPLTNGRCQDVPAEEDERVLLGMTLEGCLEPRSPGLGFGGLLLYVIHVVEVEDRDGRGAEPIGDSRGLAVGGGSCGLR